MILIPRVCRRITLCVLAAMFLVVGPWARLARAAFTDHQLTEAVGQLGDDNYRVRERAQKLLMSAGAAARPMVQRALASADLEVASRARTIMDYIDLGISPDMPEALAQAARSYRTGDADAKRAAVGVVLSSGDAAVPVLAKLCFDEKDAALRRELFSHLPYGAKRLARSLLLDGNTDTAAALLQMYAEAGDENSDQDFAAFSAATGTLEAAIIRWERETDQEAAAGKLDPDAAKLLAYLLRARGDAAGALRVARDARSGRLVRSLAAEAGEWKLAARDAEAQGDLTDIGNLAQISLERRRAGDIEGARVALERLRGLPRRDRDVACVAEAFFFNDRWRDGIGLLIEHKQFAVVFRLLCARLDYEDAFKLAQREGAADPALRLLAARQQFSLGQKEPAIAAVDAVAALVRGQGNTVDLDLAAAVIEADLEMQRPAAAMEIAAFALDRAAPSGNLHHLFAALFPGRDSGAAEWWDFLRKSSPQETSTEKLKRLSRLEDEAVPPDDFAWLVQAATATAAAPADLRDERARWLKHVVIQLHAAKRDVAALDSLQKWAIASDTTHVYLAVAEAESAVGDWPAACRFYDLSAQKHGSQVDDVDAPLVWLRGWALAHAATVATDANLAAQQRDQSQDLLQLAHALPMSTQSQHALLAQTIADHAAGDPALQAEAVAELDLSGRVGGFDTGTCIDLLPVEERSLESRGNLNAAAICAERAMVPGWPRRGPDAELAPLALPAAAHALRARAAAAAGDLKTAAVEAEACLDLLPGDAEMVCQLAPAFTAPNADASHAQELTSLYRRLVRSLSAVTTAYPDNATAHHDLGRLAVACNRDFDTALPHAEAAVKLQPDNAAFYDTLGHVRFKLGQKSEAIAAARRAVELAPNEPEYQHDLESFQAKKGK